MKPLTKNLLSYAKQLLDKSLFKKLKLIDDEIELEQALKHSIDVKLRLKQHDLEQEVSKLAANPLALKAKAKLAILPSKIKHFQVEYSEEEFYKLEKLIEEIEKEVKNVRTR